MSFSDPTLARLRHMILDMDGTIYLGKTLFPETVPFLEELQRLGIGYTFVTNNPTRSIPELVTHLAGMGIEVTQEQLATPVRPTIEHLRAHLPNARKILLVGSPGMGCEMAEEGFLPIIDLQEEPDAVVISYDPGLSYEWLCKAAWWIWQGKPYIATNPDGFCPTDRETILLDCGALIAALETATGRKPDIVIGKPEAAMAASILHRHGLRPEEVAVVGDRLRTDLAMAHRIGAVAALVLTGDSTADDAAAADPRPHLLLSNLEEFRQLLIAAHAAPKA